MGAILFYRQVEADWVNLVWPIWLTLFVMWTLTQLYTFPLLLQMERPSLKIAVRNSLVIIVRRPGPSLGWLIAVVTISLISSFRVPPLWVVITASLMLYISNRATLTAITALEN